MDTILVKTVKSRTTPIWRVGRQFDTEAKPVDLASLGKGELARLAADPALQGEAEGGEALFAGAEILNEEFAALLAGPTAEDDHDAVAELEGRVAEAITKLGHDEFTKSGKPEIDALRAALPGDAGAITSALRDKVFAAMQADGFKPPEATPPQ